MAPFTFSKTLKSVQQAPGTFEDVKDAQDLFDEVKAYINGNMTWEALLPLSLTTREIQAGSVGKDALTAATARRLGVQRTAAPARKASSELTAVAVGTGLSDWASHPYTMETANELLIVTAEFGNPSVNQNYQCHLQVNGVDAAPFFNSVLNAGEKAMLHDQAGVPWVINSNEGSLWQLYAIPLLAGTSPAPALAGAFAVRLRGLGAGAASMGIVRLYTQLLSFA